MADRDRWRDDYERDRDLDRGRERNRGMFGYEGEGYLRGGGRDVEDRDWRDEYGRGGQYSGYGGGRDYGRNLDRGELRDREYGYGSAGRELRGRDYNAGVEWGGGGYRDRGGMRDDEIAGFRGTGYLGGDYGLPRTDRGDYGRDFSGGSYGDTRGMEMDRERTRPSYRGRGPKNYQRSDERIREDVCEHLLNDDLVDASEVEVNVNNGVVTLSGSVDDRDMKRRAEDIVEACPGVRDVENQIRVARGEQR